MADAEDRLLEAGVKTPWLACAIGNTRAARFYQKAGWVLTGTQTVPTEIPGGWYPLKIWRYEKRLSARPWTWLEIEQLGPRLSPRRARRPGGGPQGASFPRAADDHVAPPSSLSPDARFPFRLVRPRASHETDVAETPAPLLSKRRRGESRARA
ncbi:hypothetical protein [Caulobacter sp. UC70_42]|uniref:hypothetical protein n=1 Tax=Caulobacter sp. UC70_42 TaxID=3374551 RepID=UPI003757ADEF